MQLGRQHLFYEEGRNRRVWLAVLAASAILVGGLSAVDFGRLTPWLTPIYNLCILLLTVAAVVTAWHASASVRRALKPLCLFGRMSLTNYLLQSVVGCFIFYGYGLACYRLVGTTWAALIGFGMVVGQYIFCRFWLSAGRNGTAQDSSPRRGPLEGLWRKLTWL